MKKLTCRKKNSLLKRLMKYREKPKATVEKPLEIMTCEEKKCFLSMDLIERMIRVEQRVALSFGKEIPYNKTEYYRSLSSKEKQGFEKYLKTKGRRKYLLAGTLFALGAIGMLSYKSPITGNVIGAVDYGPLGRILGTLFLTLIILGVSYELIVFLLNLRRKKKIKTHFEILDNVFLNKYSTKVRGTKN